MPEAPRERNAKRQEDVGVAENQRFFDGQRQDQETRSTTGLALQAASTPHADVTRLLGTGPGLL